MTISNVSPKFGGRNSYCLTIANKCVASSSCLKDHGYTENTKLVFIIRGLLLSGLETSKLQNVPWRVEHFFKWFHL